jgi:gamma-glutamylcyclotransferase (GGCT)/AIG2-like uncharacterized protein YtfP
MYAYYGSLRRGMSNYHYFEKGLEFRYQDVITGFRLHALEEYPYAVRSGDPADTLTIEVFRVTDPAIERAIHELEMEVGYVYEEIILRGEAVGIYLYKKAGVEPLVNGGDWIKFFGS